MKLYTNITEQASFQELDQSFFVEDITKPYHLPRRTRIDRHREYKSVGFAFLFGKEKNFRDILLDLFDTKLPKHIFPVNTQGALGQAPFYHDVAFVDSDGQLFVLLEHQSTLDSYMAKRCFLYYVAYLSANLHRFIQHRKKGTLPEPKFFVALNGDVEQKSYTFKHQDLFPYTKKSAGNLYDVEARNINLQYIPKKYLAQKEKAYSGFAFYVDKAERYRKAGDYFYINSALSDCKRAGYLLQYIDTDKEADDMASTMNFFEDYKRQCEYDAAQQVAEQVAKQVKAQLEAHRKKELQERKEIRKKVRQEAQQKAKLEKLKIAKSLQEKGLDAQTISDATGLSLEELEKL